MSDVKAHYDQHLARIYNWMLGDFDEKVQQMQAFFSRNQLFPLQNKTAIDLGCGNGIQSIALANLGYDVVSVDFSALLLQELKDRAQNKPVTTIESTLENTSGYKCDAGLIVCMGDTITHLSSIEILQQLLAQWHEMLTENGKLVLSFRELSIELTEEKRFIPVRSDAERILTCFLQYHADHVLVHDIVHEKNDDKWNMSVSAYKKLRLSRNQVVGMLVQAGFKIMSADVENGMLYIISRV